MIPLKPSLEEAYDWPPWRETMSVLILTTMWSSPYLRGSSVSIVFSHSSHETNDYIKTVTWRSIWLATVKLKRNHVRSNLRNCIRASLQYASRMWFIRLSSVSMIFLHPKYLPSALCVKKYLGKVECWTHTCFSHWGEDTIFRKSP